MGGISVIATLIVLFLIMVCVFIGLAVIGIECFIGGTASTVVLVIKNKDIKKSGSKIGWKVSIPIVMYLISFSIFFLFVLFFSNIN